MDFDDFFYSSMFSLSFSVFLETPAEHLVAHRLKISVLVGRMRPAYRVLMNLALRLTCLHQARRSSMQLIDIRGNTCFCARLM
jgi:hypothetical protein